jgi:hypothetical protein
LHNSFLDPPLRLDIERIGIQLFNLALLRNLCLLLPFAGQAKQLNESSWIGLSGFSQFWVRLTGQEILVESAVRDRKTTKPVEVVP